MIISITQFPSSCMKLHNNNFFELANVFFIILFFKTLQYNLIKISSSFPTCQNFVILHTYRRRVVLFLFSSLGSCSVCNARIETIGCFKSHLRNNINNISYNERLEATKCMGIAPKHNSRHVLGGRQSRTNESPSKPLIICLQLQQWKCHFISGFS